MKQMRLIDTNEKSFWQNLRSGRFARMVKEESRGRELSGPHEVFNILKPIFAENDDVERLYCIFLDTRNHIIAIEKMFSGSISSSSIYPREIVKKVIGLKAGAVILSHNHPSRHTEPSSEDKLVTRKITMALEAIDVKLHDHIIVGDDYYSMADHGLIKGMTDQFNEFLSGRKDWPGKGGCHAEETQ
jgi:DNA repair protein RadC